MSLNIKLLTAHIVNLYTQQMTEPMRAKGYRQLTSNGLVDAALQKFRINQNVSQRTVHGRLQFNIVCARSDLAD